MVITYRRTGGLFMLVILAAAALAATLLTLVVAGTVLIVAAAIAAVAFCGRAVLSRRWRNRTVAPVIRWPHETIEATVKATPSPNTHNPVRRDGNAR